MKLLITFFVSFSLLAGCALSNKSEKLTQRIPNVVGGSEESDLALQNTFNALMNEPTDPERSKRFADFLERQRDFFYIAQGLMNSFDEQLDKLHHLHTEGIELDDQDKLHFYRASYQMRIAWEFSERNLTEMEGLYRLALLNANNPQSMHHRVCGWIVKNIDKWLEEGMKKGDRFAIMNLAGHLDDVNADVREDLQDKNQKPILIPNYQKYYTVSDDDREEARQQSIHLSNDRKKTLFDTFTAKAWFRFAEERAKNQEEDIRTLFEVETRKPQAQDVLYPDPAGPGHVTGNRFPAKTFALTFDDGPHPTHTLGMFNVLQQSKIPGTFFWLSQNIQKYPSLVKQAGELRLSRASHSFSHANLPKLNEQALNHEINDALDVFQQNVGASATMFRCPYGACGPNGSVIRQMIARRNALHIFWNVDSLDWQDKNPQSVFERAKKQVEVLNRGIILFHDIHPQSVIAMRLLTDYMKEKGYQIRPLTDIISESRGSAFTSP